MTSNEREQLTALVTKAVPGPFRPFAVFDEPLDCIRVVWRDCSANEIRAGELLTILVDNYPASGELECVGFTIKGVAHICESYKISADAPWKLAQFEAVLMPEAARALHRREDIAAEVRARQMQDEENPATKGRVTAEVRAVGFTPTIPCQGPGFKDRCVCCSATPAQKRGDPSSFTSTKPLFHVESLF